MYNVPVCSLSPDLVENCSEFLTFWVVCQRKILINQEVNNSYHRYNIGHLHMGALQTYIRSGGCLVVAAGLTSLSFTPLAILCTSQNFQTYSGQALEHTPLSQTPKNSFKRWPSPRNDFVISNKLFRGPFIPLLWILFGQTGYPIKFFTYK